jgi:hypothetical protein
MHRLALLILITSGCTLYFEDGKKPTCEPDTTTVSLVDPDNLQCETFSTPTGCPEGCLCPAGVAITAPEPTWGRCDSNCEQFDEQSCLAASDHCRVARNWAQYYSNQPDSFLGCFPLDQARSQIDPLACEGLDAQGCSESSACTGLYQLDARDCASCTDTFTFEECIPATQKAGVCNGPVACDATKTCPAGTTPGTDGICYTGACIPDQFCLPPPPL